MAEKRRFTEAEFAAWRSTIPFTDEQIAAALESGLAHCHNAFMADRQQRLADFVRRTGHLTKVALREALPYLVTTCQVCALEGRQRTALYRVGSYGRCSQHRTMPALPTSGDGRFLKRDHEKKNAEFERRGKEFDARSNPHDGPYQGRQTSVLRRRKN